MDRPSEESLRVGGQTRRIFWSFAVDYPSPRFEDGKWVHGYFRSGMAPEWAGHVLLGDERIKFVKRGDAFPGSTDEGFAYRAYVVQAEPN